MGDHGQRGWGILPSPLGSLGRDGRDRQRTGPAGCSQVGRAADYRSRLGEGGKRTGVGTAGGSPRDTWEGLISGGLPQRGDEAREGPGQTPPRPGMPATGSGSPGLEASGQRQKQKARSVPERQGQPPALTGVGGGRGDAQDREGRQADGEPEFSCLHCTRTGPRRKASQPVAGPEGFRPGAGRGRRTSAPPSQLRPPQRPGWTHRAGPQRAADSSPEEGAWERGSTNRVGFPTWAQAS